MAESPRIEELKRRVQLDPASIAFAALAEEYRRAGRFEDAIATCIAGLPRHPSYLSAHVTLGRALIEVGRLDDADEELQYVLQRAPENLVAIRGLAEIHHRRGDVIEEYHEDHDAAAAASPVAPVAQAPVAPVALAPAAAVTPAPVTAAPVVAAPVALTPGALAPGALAPGALTPVPPAWADGPRAADWEPRPDPALAGLQAFLASIVRARHDQARF